MKVIWFEEAWDDYLYWQTQDKKTIKRINLLLQDTKRNMDEASTRKKTDLLSPLSIDTRGWKFDKEEANEQ